MSLESSLELTSQHALPVGPTPDQSQDKEVAALALCLPPTPSLHVASVQFPSRAGDGETPCEPHCEGHGIKAPDSPGPGLVFTEWYGNGSKGVLQQHRELLGAASLETPSGSPQA